MSNEIPAMTGIAEAAGDHGGDFPLPRLGFQLRAHPGAFGLDHLAAVDRVGHPVAEHVGGFGGGGFDFVRRPWLREAARRRRVADGLLDLCPD